MSECESESEREREREERRGEERRGEERRGESAITLLPQLCNRTWLFIYQYMINLIVE